MSIPVLHVITRLEPGGAQRNTLYTVGHLDRARWAPGLAWGPGDELDEQARELQDVRLFEIEDLVRPVSAAKDLRALRHLRAAIRSFEPEIVHTHSSKAGVLGRLAARLERVPVVVHSVHGFGFTPLQRPWTRAAFVTAEKLAGRWTRHFIAVSHANRDLGVQKGLFTPDQVSVIRSGIELERFRNPSGGDEVRRSLGLPPGVPVVTQVGNFKPQKAPLDFVRMAAQVVKRNPEPRFVMVGEGPLRGQAEALATELGIADRVLMCGWWDRIPELLAATRVSVLSSRHEGLPRAVVESLAAGVPVVATAVDGTVEVVRPGVNGLLVSPGDVAGLAQGVCTLIEDTALWQRMSEAATQGLEDFDIDLMVHQQEELYACLLGRNLS